MHQEHQQSDDDLRNIDQREEMQVEQEEKPEPTRRPLNNRSQPSMMSAIRTGHEEYHGNTR
jgi:hypothetical protein